MLRRLLLVALCLMAFATADSYSPLRFQLGHRRLYNIISAQPYDWAPLPRQSRSSGKPGFIRFGKRRSDGADTEEH